MNRQSADEIPPASGEELKPAVTKLWIMLLFFLLMVPGGAIAAWCWWYQVEFPGGKVLNSAAGIVGLLAIPIGGLLALVMVALIATAKRVVIGENCIQLLSQDRVAVHIPFENIETIETTGEDSAGTVVIKLRDPNDPLTRVPSGTKDRYEIQSLIYGKSPAQIRQMATRRLARVDAG